jgi:ATP-binding cassette subfamily B protein
LLVLQGILPIGLVYLTKSVVDSLVGALASDRSFEAIWPTLVLICLTVAILVATELGQCAAEWVRVAQAEEIQDYIKGLVHRQSATLDIAVYESPEYHDRLERARNEAAARPLALLESIGGLVQNGLTFVAMGAVLVQYGIWLPIVLLVSVVPALVVVLKFDRRYHLWWQAATGDRRRAQYYDALLTSPSTAAEVRVFGLGPLFQAMYQTLRGSLRTTRIRLVRDQSLARLVAGALSLLISGLALIWMVWRALQGALSLGDLALFYQAFNRGQGLARALLGNLGQVYSNSLFLENLFELLDLRREVLDPAAPHPAPTRLEHGITFENVTFRYPGSQQPTLRNLNLFVPAGKIVAVVGPNGAGKTSLMKLLCRFYDPEEGSIQLDGCDLRGHLIEDLWRRITILFQFPAGYYLSAFENIALGNPATSAHPPDIEAAARSAEAHELIKSFPQGYQTILGKVFPEGIELSGGEWQRIAMARAYFRQAPIMLLDEPTSYMDSWAEAEWFEHFRRLARERTAIVITHRFTIAMRADIIHVMDQGRIVESGSHHDLIAQDGLYASSWRAQVQAGATVPESAS